MKKIIFIMVLAWFMFCPSAKADLITPKTSILESGVEICVDGVRHHMVMIMDSNNYRYYFLNLNSNNYNLDFSSYYEIDFASSGFDPHVKEYASYGKILGSNRYIHESVVQKMWQVLYPGKKINICSPSDIGVYEAVTKSYNAFTNIENGPDFFNEVYYLEENEEKSFASSYLRYFEIVNNVNVEYSITNDNLNIIAGKNGDGYITLKRKANNFKESRLFTDGTNYLLSSGSFPDKEYVIKFAIGYKKFTFMPYDQTKQKMPNTKFKIYQNKKLYKEIQTNEEGVYEDFLPEGDYVLKNEAEDFQTYFFITDDFTLNSKVVPNIKKPKPSSLNSTTLFAPSLKDIIANVKEEDKNQEESEVINVTFPDTLWLI